MNASPTPVFVPRARLSQSLHHTDETGQRCLAGIMDRRRRRRICKQTVPEMIVMSDTCFCEYTSHGHRGVLCEHGVDTD
ncbi:hypothetical protein ACLB1Q_14120 [Escherichia coli]